MSQPRLYQFFLLIFIVFFFGVASGQAQDKPDIQHRNCSTQKWRPSFHYSALNNWISGPIGILYNDRVYHLYYQYHPNSTMYWGHATSSDLVSWVERDIALGPDENGIIFSGSCVVDTGNTTGFQEGDRSPIVAIYTSYKQKKDPADKDVEMQSLAYSLDNGMTFRVDDHNTVYKDRNTIMRQKRSEVFRDLKVVKVKQPERWIIVMTAHDRVEFYSSVDLKSWTFLAHFGDKEGNHEGVWGCPDLIPLEVRVSDDQVVEKWLLLISIDSGGPNGGSATQYFIGDFNSKTGEFETDPSSGSQWLDWGPDNYAGVALADNTKNSTVYIGWMSNWKYANVTPTESWRGRMTIPRQIELVMVYLPKKSKGGGDDGDGGREVFRIKTTPLPEMKNLRVPEEELMLDSFTVPVDSKRVIEVPFGNPLMEVEVNISSIPVSREKFHFLICAANSKPEEVCFGLHRNQWLLDRHASDDVKYTKENTAVLSEEARARREIAETTTSIRLFFDTSSMEAFADDGLTAMTAIVFPMKPYDRIYINHWSEEEPNSKNTKKKAKSHQSIKIDSFRVWGLRCWYTDEVKSRAKQ